MVKKRIVKSVENYLKAVNQKGIPVKFGVLFGSYAKGKEHQWSDIDLLVVSSRYDKTWDYEDWAELWRIAAHTDYRIEPIPVGEKEFKKSKDSMIIAVARQEGQIIPLAE